MKKRILLFLAILLWHAYLAAQAFSTDVYSPNKLLRLKAGLNQTGTPYYSVTFNKQLLIGESKLGFKTAQFDLKDGFSLVQQKSNTHQEKWTPVWGETANIMDHYNEWTMELRDKTGHLIQLIFRVYNEGIGFRYVFPAQEGLSEIRFTDELTEFKMTGDHQAWWIPGDYDSNEHVYSTSTISQINTDPYTVEKSIYTQHIVDKYNVQTPLTMRTRSGVHLSIAEAALVDFPAMHLSTEVNALKFKSFLIPSPDPAIKSTNKLPFSTPWRAILIAPDAPGLLTNHLILNLNEPCKIKDVSWIKPQKYVGIWWEMHVGKSTWDYAGSQNAGTAQGLVPTGKHGATTANTKKYIDFAAKYGFDGVLVEGWNVGWEDWFGKMKDEVFDFSKPYPDYDMDALSKYAKEKGVKIVMHHETSSAVPSYERQMRDAYIYMKNHGINTVKTGYVGHLLPKGEWHDGQWMINHYIRVAEETAKNNIMLDAHEPVRPSGLHRTYPNWLACEAARGQEFNAWSKGNPPEHECILPFTRILGGPMDYTPGIFEVRMNTYDPNKKEVVHTTVAKQLALYVTLYSPLQMAADLIENYEKRLDVFQFIRDVPVDWDKTVVPAAAVGDYIITARKQKGQAHWYLGAITDENPLTKTISLSFLEKGKVYEATIYEDGPGAHWEKNPYPVNIRKLKVTRNSKLKIQMAAGGGYAAAIKAL
jgi:hypothetical protein